jgi:hypothetical protein
MDASLWTKNMLPVMAAVVTVSCTYKSALESITAVFKEFVFSGMILSNLIYTKSNKAMYGSKLYVLQM